MLAVAQLVVCWIAEGQVIGSMPGMHGFSSVSGVLGTVDKALGECLLPPLDSPPLVGIGQKHRLSSQSACVSKISSPRYHKKGFILKLMRVIFVFIIIIR